MIGIGVIWFGWLLGHQRLTDLVAGAPSMKANTALSIAIAGISLVCLVSSRPWIRHAGRVLAIGCVLIGAATLFEYAIGSDLGIDQAIARDEWTTGFPGRMAILTAANIFALGLALFAVPAPSFWLSQIGAAAVATTAFVTLIGYAYDSASIFRSSERRYFATDFRYPFTFNARLWTSAMRS